jgi:hypothetical protein
MHAPPCIACTIRWVSGHRRTHTAHRTSGRTRSHALLRKKDRCEPCLTTTVGSSFFFLVHTCGFPTKIYFAWIWQTKVRERYLPKILIIKCEVLISFSSKPSNSKRLRSIWFWLVNFDHQQIKLYSPISIRLLNPTKCWSLTRPSQLSDIRSHDKRWPSSPIEYLSFTYHCYLSSLLVSLGPLVNSNIQFEK